MSFRPRKGFMNPSSEKLCKTCEARPAHYQGLCRRCAVGPQKAYRRQSAEEERAQVREIQRIEAAERKAAAENIPDTPAPTQTRIIGGIEYAIVFDGTGYLGGSAQGLGSTLSGHSFAIRR